MASKFELNDTTPAAPGGRINVAWQWDASGNVSANVPAASGAQTPWTSHIDAAGFELRGVGRIGVGTASPVYKIQVVGGRVMIEAASEPYALGVRHSAGSTVAWVGAASNGDLVVSEAGGAERMRVTQGGNVGIGAASPTCRMTVVDTSRAYDHPTVGQASFMISSGGGTVNDEQLMAGVHDGDYSWIQSVKPGIASRNLILNGLGGNVGIRTAAPTAQLHVAGDGNTNVVRISPYYDLNRYLFVTPESAAGQAQIGYWQGVAFGVLEIMSPVKVTSLPNANPGAGTKQLWYDPADGNRVKFAA